MKFCSFLSIIQLIMERMIKTFPYPQNIRELTSKLLRISRLFMATPFVENTENDFKISKIRFSMNALFFLTSVVLGVTAISTSIPFSYLPKNPYMLLSSMRLCFSLSTVFITTFLTTFNTKRILNVINRLISINSNLTVRKKYINYVVLYLSFHIFIIIGGTMWNTSARLFQREYNNPIRKYMTPVVTVCSFLSRDTQELLILYLFIVIVLYVNAIHDKLIAIKQRNKIRTPKFLLPEMLETK